MGDHAKHATSLQQDRPAVVVRVTPRRTRIVVLTLVVVGAIVALTVLFFQGVEIHRFDARAKSSADQKKLLDDFNSYSAYVSSAFGKPIEMFVAMAVQVAVLRVLATSLTQPQPRWWVGLTALAVSAGVGYLVGNGFNALNVQLRARAVSPAISATDLATPTESTAGSSLANQSFSEITSANPATNTVLRNLLLQIAPRPEMVCPSLDRLRPVVDQFLINALPRLDWFSRVLPRGLEPKRFGLVVNANNASAVRTSRTGDLPMNATLAADLVLYMMIHGRQYFGNFKVTDFQDQNAMQDRLVDRFNSRAITRVNGSMAEFLGLLPWQSDDDTKTNETTRREMLLTESANMVKNNFYNNRDIKKSSVSLEFSHLDISPQVAFDAVTMEYEVDPTRLANAASADNKTHYTNVARLDNCGPWPGLCLVDKVKLRTISSTTPIVEQQSQVKVMSPCVDDKGNERLMVEVSNGARDLIEFPKCPKTSNSSLLVVSFAKRLAADEIVQNVVRNASGEFPDAKQVTIVNLRKIFTITFGRLSWRLEDLAAANNAECSAASPSKCLGLQLPLAPASNQTESKQRLVVGAGAIPTDQFVPQGKSFVVKPRFVTLAEVFEPASSGAEAALGGDPLLVHNIGKVTWNATLPDPSESKCDSAVEERLRLIIDNHYYSEHSLQPAYTAATWFLFQNAVVRQTIALNKGLESLDFAANVQDIAVWISTPKKSAWLTLAGCFLLAVALLAAVVRSFVRSNDHPLECITDPHVIARVLVNEEQYPPLVLRRRVAQGDDQYGTADKRIVGALSLRPIQEAAPEDDARQTKRVV